VCRASNPNSVFVSGTDELTPDMFTPDETIGICGATSTPMWLMEDVKRHLESF
jgi:4-hydroxy-3-methylbut-2-enyl diphosphate reductase